jgi:hypothetical protein
MSIIMRKIPGLKVAVQRFSDIFKKFARYCLQLFIQIFAYSQIKIFFHVLRRVLHLEIEGTSVKIF